MPSLSSTFQPAARLAPRLVLALGLCLAAAAGSCNAPPLESRLPLSEPGEAAADPRLAGTWGEFANGKLRHILRIGGTGEQPFTLILQSLDDEPPLYMTAFATEVAGTTVYNVRRVAGIGQDYTLMARGGCTPYSPAHAPGYMLFWATLSADGTKLALHEFTLPDADGTDVPAPGPDPRVRLRTEPHTNALYPDVSVVESDPRLLRRYLALREEPGYETESADLVRETRRYRRLDDFAAKIKIPERFAARARALMTVSRTRYALGDMAGLAASHDDIAFAVECLGLDKLDAAARQTYLAVMVAGGRSAEALALADAAGPDERDGLLFAVGHARLRSGDLAGARDVEARIGKPAYRDWLAYLRALSASAAGDRDAALAALDRLPPDYRRLGVAPNLVADQYLLLGAPERAERVRSTITARVLAWMPYMDGSPQSLAEHCTEAVLHAEFGVEEETFDVPLDIVVWKLILLDRPEVLRRVMQRHARCWESEHQPPPDVALIGYVWLGDAAAATQLAAIADANRTPGDSQSMRLDWAAAAALARAGRPRAAQRLLRAAGMPPVDVAFEDSGQLSYYGAALGMTAGALARAGDADAATGLLLSLFEAPPASLAEAEARAAAAILAAVGTTDIMATVTTIARLVHAFDDSPQVVSRMAFSDLMSQPWSAARLAALRRQVLGSPLAQRVLVEARAMLDVRLAAADRRSGEQPTRLGIHWLDMARTLDFLTAPGRRGRDLLPGAVQETEGLAAPAIRVENHLALAMILSALGDSGAAIEPLRLAHEAAMEQPLDGTSRLVHGVKFNLGITIR